MWYKHLLVLLTVMILRVVVHRYVYSLEYGRTVNMSLAHDDAISQLSMCEYLLVSSSWDSTVKVIFLMFDMCCPRVSILNWPVLLYRTFMYYYQFLLKSFYFNSGSGCKVLWWVCLCVYVVCLCLSVHEDISGITRTIFTKFFMHVAYGCGSVLRHCCDTLFTSGFMDDIMFSSIMGRSL